MDIQKSAVASGHWPLFRYNPLAVAEGRPPLHLDSKAPSVPYKDYAYKQTRFKMLAKSNPEEARRLLGLAEQDASARWRLYEQMAGVDVAADAGPGTE